MTKIILATLFAISFNVFADHHDGATTTPPAAEGTTPPATGDAGATGATKMDKKGKAHTATAKKDMAKAAKGKAKDTTKKEEGATTEHQ